MTVRITEAHDGGNWVRCGEGEYEQRVRVTRSGLIIPAIGYFWAGDVPNLIACLEAARELAKSRESHDSTPLDR